MEMSIESLVKRFDNLRADRKTLDNWWNQISHYVIPRKYGAGVIEPLHQRDDEILPEDVYDSTAVQSLNILAAGLHGYLTNPASRWFSLRPRNRNLMKDQNVKQWFHEVENIMFDILNNSNFSQQIHETYIDLGAYGTANLALEEDDEDIIRFYTRSIAEIYIIENKKGKIDGMFRFYPKTALQAWEEWGQKGNKANLGSSITAAIDQEKWDEKFEILHYIAPRKVRDLQKLDKINKPFLSFFIAYKDKQLISEGGFDEFPIFCPRFSKVSGKKYGFSPSMNALSDIKMLNQMNQTTIRSAQKIVDPPLEVFSDSYLLPLDSDPGGINYKTDSSNQTEIKPIKTGGNIPVSLELMNQVRDSIKAAFFVDMFIALTNQKNMTATEVQERVAEKMLILGPTLGRLMTELLDPAIQRIFNILLRKKLLPPLPPSLSKLGKPNVEYISPLAKAQKASEAQSIINMLNIIGGLAEAKPEILDNLNVDKIADIVANVHGVPPEVMLSDKKVKELRQARAEQIQAQQQREGVAEMTANAETAAKADKALAQARKG